MMTIPIQRQRTLMRHASWNAELAVLWRRDRCFRARRSGRNPVVGNRLSAVQLIIRSRSSRARILTAPWVRVHVLPHDLPIRRDLKQPPLLPLVDERIAVRQTSRVADVRAPERPARASGILAGILPNDFLLDGVDLQYARPSGYGQRKGRISRRAFVVEDEKVAGAWQSFGDDVRIVLATRTIHRPRHSTVGGWL